MNLISKEEKCHWGNRLLELPGGRGYLSPTLVAGVSLGGVVKMKKGMFSDRISKSSLVYVDENLEVQPRPPRVPQPIEAVLKGLKPEGFPKLKNKPVYRVNAKEVRTRISLFLDAMPGRKILYMVTVTFPPEVTDELACKYRNAWETMMRKENYLVHFLWIAERQKNGTMHFHFAVFNRLPIQRANVFMRKILKKGYKDGEFKCDYYKLKSYNGVDLAKNKYTKRVWNFATNRKSLSDYLTKYITKGKDDKTNNFPGRAWGCSRSLSNLVSRFSLTQKEYDLLLEQYGSELQEVEIEDENIRERIQFFRWVKGCPQKYRDWLATVNLGVIIQAENMRGSPFDLFSNN